MKNRYDGTCARCGMDVAAGAGNVTKRDGRWVVAHDECPEITSGLGIGGAGQHSLAGEMQEMIATGEIRIADRPKRRGSSGQLWEPCARRGCENEPVCVDCGYCNRHCNC